MIAMNDEPAPKPEQGQIPDPMKEGLLAGNMIDDSKESCPYPANTPAAIQWYGGFKLAREKAERRARQIISLGISVPTLFLYDGATASRMLYNMIMKDGQIIVGLWLGSQIGIRGLEFKMSSEPQADLLTAAVFRTKGEPLPERFEGNEMAEKAYQIAEGLGEFMKITRGEPAGPDCEPTPDRLEVDAANLFRAMIKGPDNTPKPDEVS